MRNKVAFAALAALASMPAIMSAPAVARSGDYYENNSRYYYDDSGNRVYRERGGHYRGECGSGDGAVGTVAGGAGGAVLGNVLGGGLLGTLAGGVGGALVGRSLDKEHTRDRNNC